MTEQVLNWFEDSELARCRELRARCQSALMRANPDLPEIQMQNYLKSFDQSLPELRSAIRDARAEAIAKSLSAEDLAILERLSKSEETLWLMTTLQKLAPHIGEATKRALETTGMAIHMNCAQVALQLTPGAE